MFNTISRSPMYDQDAVQPMRDELIAVGFKELLSPNDVKESLLVNDDKTALVMIKLSLRVCCWKCKTWRFACTSA